ncbi:hypothetical protein JOM56_008158 [Amanita muscaria]
MSVYVTLAVSRCPRSATRNLLSCCKPVTTPIAIQYAGDTLLKAADGLRSPECIVGNFQAPIDSELHALAMYLYTVRRTLRAMPQETPCFSPIKCRTYIMKTTSVAVLALVSASALAKPIAVTLDTRDIAPSELTDIEARRVNWHKVGGFAKGAARFGADVLFRRDEDGELLARDFDDDSLEARDDIEGRRVNWHKVGGFAKGAAKFGASILFRRDEDDDLLARDFDDDYLEARDDLEARRVNWHKVGGFAKGAARFGADVLFRRDEDGELLARDFDDAYLEARDFDEYLEARDLEERSRLSAISGAAHAFQHGHHGHHLHFHASQQDNDNDRRDLQERFRLSEIRGAFRPGRRIHFHAPQQQNNDNDRRDLTERSLLGSFGITLGVGENIFHHAHQVHQVASYIPQRQNNNNNNRNQRRDLVEAGGLYDLD